MNYQVLCKPGDILELFAVAIVGFFFWEVLHMEGFVLKVEEISSVYFSFNVILGCGFLAAVIFSFFTKNKKAAQ